MQKAGTSECGMLGVGGAYTGGHQGDLEENESTEHMRNMNGRQGGILASWRQIWVVLKQDWPMMSPGANPAFCLLYFYS